MPESPPCYNFCMVKGRGTNGSNTEDTMSKYTAGQAVRLTQDIHSESAQEVDHADGGWFSKGSVGTVSSVEGSASGDIVLVVVDGWELVCGYTDITPHDEPTGPGERDLGSDEANAAELERLADAGVDLDSDPRRDTQQDALAEITTYCGLTEPGADAEDVAKSAIDLMRQLVDGPSGDEPIDPRTVADALDHAVTVAALTQTFDGDYPSDMEPSDEEIAHSEATEADDPGTESYPGERFPEIDEPVCTHDTDYAGAPVTADGRCARCGKAARRVTDADPVDAWSDYLVDQLADVVEAGHDLDEWFDANAPSDLDAAAARRSFDDAVRTATLHLDDALAIRIGRAMLSAVPDSLIHGDHIESSILREVLIEEYNDAIAERARYEANADKREAGWIGSLQEQVAEYDGALAMIGIDTCGADCVFLLLQLEDDGRATIKRGSNRIACHLLLQDTDIDVHIDDTVAIFNVTPVEPRS